ncbi:MAG: translation initiation factor IF-5A, partial [Hadesarchaea archaeon]|nr:translation initiation factor IF-5A [Hadesarchaea archaeon]
EVSELREKEIIFVEGEPAKIKKISSSMPGKHGHAKYSIQTIGVFDGRKRNLSEPSESKVEIPDVERGKAQVISLSGPTAQLMSMSDYETFEVEVSSDLQGDLSEGDEVEFIRIGNNSKIEEKSR